MVISLDRATYAGLAPVPVDDVKGSIAGLLADGEELLAAFNNEFGEGLVFTNKRVIVRAARGLTGKKRDFTSLPYSRIQAFSIETTSGTDVDPEMVLAFPGLGRVKFDFKGHADVAMLSRVIGGVTLQLS